MTMELTGVVLNQGYATGKVIRLDEPLSFWGGYDPATGKVIDRHHPQVGATVAKKILVLPASRGSAGTPAGVAESLRTGHGPLAIIVASADVNITIGAMVADKLYASATPVIAITTEQIKLFETDQNVSVDAGGVVRFLAPA